MPLALRVISITSFLGLLLYFSFTPVSASPRTDCGSVVSPGQSIQAAINNPPANKIICIKPGTYHEEIDVNKTGLTITAFDPSNRPVIDGEYKIPGGTTTRNGTTYDYNYAPLINISADSVTVDGIVVNQSKGIGILIKSSKRLNDINVINNVVKRSRVFGLSVNETDNTLVQNNLFEGNSSKNFAPINARGGSQIRSEGTDGVKYLNNIVRYGGSEGIIIDGNDGESRNSLVADNIIHDNGASSLYSHATNHATWERNLIFASSMNPWDPDTVNICVMLRGVEEDYIKAGKIKATTFGNIIFRNNIVWGCRTTGIAPGGLVTYKNVDFNHNTIVSIEAPPNSNEKISSLSLNASRVGDKFENISIANNIFHTYGNFNYSPVGRAGAGTSVVKFTGNIWSATFDSSEASYHNLDRAKVDSKLMGQDGKGTFKFLTAADRPKNDAEYEELYRDMREWFKLKPDSPAINTAAASTADKDFYGTSRPVGSKADVGAHEFGGVVPPASPTPTDTPSSWDLNQSGEVDLFDFSWLVKGFNQALYDFPDFDSFLSAI
jgi:hypothetical protein